MQHKQIRPDSLSLFKRSLLIKHVPDTRSSLINAHNIQTKQRPSRQMGAETKEACDSDIFTRSSLFVIVLIRCVTMATRQTQVKGLF